MRIAAALLLGFVVALAAPASRAQEAGIYLGGSLGQAKYQGGECPSFGARAQCDSSDKSWRLFGGYQFNRHFSAELGYADLGQISAQNVFRFFSITQSSSSNVDTETVAWDLSIVGILPIAEHLSLIGRAGLYRADIKTRDTRTTNLILSLCCSTGTAVTESRSRESGVMFGLGAQYDFMRRLGLRAEWQRYGKIGTGETGERDIDVLSAGLVYRF
jgi:OmpA-OmpF porin, OOP family